MEIIPLCFPKDFIILPTGIERVEIIPLCFPKDFMIPPTGFERVGITPLHCIVLQWAR